MLENFNFTIYIINLIWFNHRPQIRIEQETVQVAPSHYPSYGKQNYTHHIYEATSDSDGNSEMPTSPQTSSFTGFASHTSPSFIKGTQHYTDASPKKSRQNNQPSHPNSHSARNFENYLDNPPTYGRATNVAQVVTPIIYTEAHSELGIVQPKTAKKISTAGSLNDFNFQQPQSGRVIFDMPKKTKNTMIWWIYSWNIFIFIIVYRQQINNLI